VAEFKPMCIAKKTCIAYVNSGHILPCCFADGDRDRFKLLMPEHLKVKNVESIEDIVTSPEWLKFFDGLMNYPKLTEEYHHCKQICTFEGDIDIDPTAKRIKTKEQYK
jgi:hypothetical protein|tara:strand:- start:669 stop:992 length:324 start_codon:yes stop_codon:yes gene_type:complete